MNIELTEEEVKLIIASLMLMWRLAEAHKTSYRATMLGKKLQNTLTNHRKTLDIDQGIVYNENS